MRRRAVIALAALSGIALAAPASVLVIRERGRVESLRPAESAYAEHRYADAHRSAIVHLRRWPDDRQALLVAARSLGRMGAADRAGPLFEKAGGPYTIEDLHARADGLVAAGRRAEAASAYRGLLDREPDDVLALRRLAALEIAADRVREASRLADRLAAIPKGAVIGHTLRGVIAYNGGTFEEAASAFSRVLELDPDLEQMPLDPPQMFWGYLAHSLLNLGRAADARAHLLRALERHPGDAGFMDQLARTYEKEGRMDEAARCWRRAAEWDPNMPSPWLNLGRMTLIAGDPAEAVPLLERAAELAPEAPEPCYSLSLALRRLGRVEEADRLRLEADRLKDPDPPQAP
ncbi:tetratricopeptide repeat protein [Tautonia plasticadhaerens]|uniref:Cellulose synthase subunit BcsC n=1 Tax=Tautonia plasticadhaerens TaxID=2527974 RepID=A0A518H0J1_9BACT|nr:tetratricopeptide repeat protein [Tautonia plasticadhaerens]QDV34354.1 cellulose synthase subunit BcsC [Tautonia plasticadhaerens]